MGNVGTRALSALSALAACALGCAALAVPATGASAGRDGASVEMVVDLWPGAVSGYIPDSVAHLDGSIYFSAESASGYADELWRSDGTEAGTLRVKDISPPLGGHFFSMFRSGGAIYFAGLDGPHQEEPWRTDGTARGTFLLKDIFTTLESTNSTYGSKPQDFVEFDGRVFFTARDAEHGYGLWMTDGTPGGTTRLDADRQGRSFFSPSDLRVVGETLYFVANGEHDIDRELWKTDGTAAGTGLVADIRSGDLASNPTRLTALGDSLVFAADDGAAGQELWRSDGTAQGTYRVKDINPGHEGSFIREPTEMDEVVYFSASSPGVGEALWRTDGTEQGTWPVSVDGVVDFPHPRELTPVGDQLYFSQDSPHGRELWRTDGTAMGTAMVTDIAPGPMGSEPTDLTAFNDTVVFSADDGTTGREPWRSDGTAAGTQPLGDVNPGASSSEPSGFIGLRGSLLFAADDGAHGQELWRLSGPLLEAARPATTITKGPDPGTTTSDADVTFEFASSGADGAVFECRLDDAWFTRCTSPHTFAAVAPGPHTAAFRAVSGDGYVDPTPAQRSFTMAGPPLPSSLSDSPPAISVSLHGKANSRKGTIGVSLATPTTGFLRVTQRDRPLLQPLLVRATSGVVPVTLKLTTAGKARLRAKLRRAVRQGGDVGALRVEVTFDFIPDVGDSTSLTRSYVFKLRERSRVAG